MSAGKNAMVTGAGLATLEVASGGLGNGLVSMGVENLIDAVSATANGVVSNVDTMFTGGLIPAATATWALFRGSEKYSEKGIPGVVESAAWRYGLAGSALGLLGVATMPATLTALGVGGSLMALRGATGLGKDVGENPTGIMSSIVSAPFKGLKWGVDAFRGRGTPATS